MDIGLYLNTQAPLSSDPDALAARMVEQTRLARDAGFDLVASGQHYLADYHQLQQIPLLGRLAAEAGDMTLATGVNLLPLHHPIEIAEQVATLSTFADVVAGVGAGYRDVEFESFDVPKAERGPRLGEGIELMNRLWTETDVTYSGDYYSVEDVTINPRPETKPPVWVAANATPAIRRAARLGDAWFVNPHSKFEEIARGKRIYDEIRDERGESREVPVFRETFVAPTTEEARSIAREHLASKYQRYLEWGQDEAMADGADLKRSFERLAEDRFLIGTPEEVCAEIDAYRRELEASHVILRTDWPGLPADDAADCIRLIGDEVIPNL